MTPTREQIIQSTAEKIKYENCVLHVNGEDLQWEYLCRDATTREHRVLRGRVWTMTATPTDRLEREVVTTALLGIVTILEHEARELFMFEGKRIFDPHTRPFATTEDKDAMKILRNSAKCLNCGDVIESTYRHDFACCTCGNVCVDGGKDYLHRVGNSDQWVDTSVTEYDADDEYRDPGPRKEDTNV